MLIRISCPNCGQIVRVPARIKGRPARCPYCEEVFRVPRIVLPLLPWDSVMHRDTVSNVRAIVRAVVAAIIAAGIFGLLIVAAVFFVFKRPSNDRGQQRKFEEANHIESDDPAKALADAFLQRRRLDASVDAQRKLGHLPNDKAIVSRRTPFKNLADLVEFVEPSIVRINTFGAQYKGTASGFVIDSSEIIVTNYHVLIDIDEANVVFRDGRTVRIAGYVNLAPEKDLALLTVQALPGQLQPLALSPVQPRKGEEVAAFGAPLGLSFSTTRGIVSGIRSSAEMRSAGMLLDVQWIQTDAAVSVGNSGGPLVNMRGEVVGVNTVTSGRQAQNLNFAISAEAVREVLQQASIVPVPLGKRVRE